LPPITPQFVHKFSLAFANASLSPLYALVAVTAALRHHRHQGTIQAPPDQFGETLESEQLHAGSFIDAGRVDTDQWDKLMEVNS
jgi:hypothetical protein